MRHFFEVHHILELKNKLLRGVFLKKTLSWAFILIIDPKHSMTLCQPRPPYKNKNYFQRSKSTLEDVAQTSLRRKHE